MSQAETELREYASKVLNCYDELTAEGKEPGLATLIVLQDVAEGTRHLNDEDACFMVSLALKIINENRRYH